MNTAHWSKIALATAASLIVATGVAAQSGQINCPHGPGGGMQCAMGKATAVPFSASPATKTSLKITLKITAKITAKIASPVKPGDNALDITVANAAGKPLTSAKIAAQVAMTLMDMGTTSPPIKELGKGHYGATVNFSMSGPWRVTVKVAAPDQKPQTKAFDFTAS